MLVLHDSNGFVTGLQTFPLTSELAHIVASDELFASLQPLVNSDFRLINIDGDFVLPENINDALSGVTLEKRRAEKLQEIEAAQFAELQGGVPFNFGSAPDIVQTSSERDLINISGITMRGLLLRADAVTDAVIEFRALSNTSYMITGQQAIDLGATVAQHTEQIYSKAWQLKDAINAAQSINELEAIQW